MPARQTLDVAERTPDLLTVKLCWRFHRLCSLPSIFVLTIKAVLRIHDILVWIRIPIWIRGSMPLTNGSFSVYYFLKVYRYLHNFSKIKSKKESLAIFACLAIEGSGSGSIPLTNGSGSGFGSGSATLYKRYPSRLVRLYPGCCT